MPRKRPEDEPVTLPSVHLSGGRYTGPIPTPAAHWLPQTRSWYNSLKISPHSELFSASDWATAVCAAESYDVWARTHNASTLGSFVRLSERLGATFSDRRRAKVEAEPLDVADADEDAADEAVRGWQSRLTKPDLKVVR